MTYRVKRCDNCAASNAPEEALCGQCGVMLPFKVVDSEQPPCLPVKTRSPPGKDGAPYRFRNPANGYIEQISPLSWLWALLFGPLFFAVKGIWGHAAVSLFLAIPTLGLSNIGYAILAGDIVYNHYLRMGWARIRP